MDDGQRVISNPLLLRHKTWEKGGVNRDACIELRLRKVALTPDHTLLSKLVSITCLQHAFLLSGTQP